MIPPVLLFVHNFEAPPGSPRIDQPAAEGFYDEARALSPPPEGLRLPDFYQRDFHDHRFGQLDFYQRDSHDHRFGQLGSYDEARALDPPPEGLRLPDFYQRDSHDHRFGLLDFQAPPGYRPCDIAPTPIYNGIHHESGIVSEHYNTTPTLPSIENPPPSVAYYDPPSNGIIPNQVNRFSNNRARANFRSFEDFRAPPQDYRPCDIALTPDNRYNTPRHGNGIYPQRENVLEPIEIPPPPGNYYGPPSNGIIPNQVNKFSSNRARGNCQSFEDLWASPQDYRPCNIALTPNNRYNIHHQGNGIYPQRGNAPEPIENSPPPGNYYGPPTNGILPNQGNRFANNGSRARSQWFPDFQMPATRNNAHPQGNGILHLVEIVPEQVLGLPAIVNLPPSGAYYGSLTNGIVPNQGNRFPNHGSRGGFPAFISTDIQAPPSRYWRGIIVLAPADRNYCHHQGNIHGQGQIVLEHVLTILLAPIENVLPPEDYYGIVPNQVNRFVNNGSRAHFQRSRDFWAMPDNMNNQETVVSEEVPPQQPVQCSPPPVPLNQETKYLANEPKAHFHRFHVFAEPDYGMVERSNEHVFFTSGCIPRLYVEHVKIVHNYVIGRNGLTSLWSLNDATLIAGRCFLEDDEPAVMFTFQPVARNLPNIGVIREDTPSEISLHGFYYCCQKFCLPETWSAIDLASFQKYVSLFKQSWKEVFIRMELPEADSENEFMINYCFWSHYIRQWSNETSSTEHVRKLDEYFEKLMAGPIEQFRIIPAASKQNKNQQGAMAVENLEENIPEVSLNDIFGPPSAKPQYTDEESDSAEELEAIKAERKTNTESATAAESFDIKAHAGRHVIPKEPTPVPVKEKKKLNKNI